MLRAARRQAALASGQRLFSAVPALSTQDAPIRSGGFFSKLFIGGSPRVATPLTEPLEGGLTPPQEPGPTTAPTTRASALGNGVTVAAENTPGPTASFGVYVNCGSVYETDDNAGISHLLEAMAFKATQHRTHFRLVREVENIGASFAASASREQMVYVMDTTKAAIPEALEILADAVLNPRFTAWEVAAAAAQLEDQVKELGNSPASLLLEGLHGVAYEGGLGRPLIAVPGALSRISADQLSEFVQRQFVGGNMVVAGGGVDQAELAQLAEPLFGGIAGGKTKEPSSRYTGGDFRTAATSAESDALLAFEVPGGWRSMKTSIAVTALQFLLGGGGSFSSGGPGKGMHSRLYRRVLNKHGWVSNATAFSTLYNDSGLAGIHITTDSRQIDRGVDIAVEELQALTKEVPEEELQRAKNAALGTVLSSLESRSVVSEDIGRQTLTYGSRKPVPEFMKTLNELTAKDISDLVTGMLKLTPAFAGHGNLTQMPRYDALCRRF